MNDQGENRNGLLQKGGLKFIILIDITTIVIAAVWSVLHPGSPRESFEEWGIVTIISGFQLLVIGFISLEIFWTRNKTKISGGGIQPYHIWLIISMGFVYMAFDDVFEFHEGLDHMIHHQLGIHETGLTDRLDDIIVAGYLIIGLWLLHVGREEIIKYADAFDYFRVVLVLVIVMVIVDVVSNKEDVLAMFISNDQLCHDVWISLEIVEEMIKLLAGGVILASVIHCREIAKKMKGESKTSSADDPVRSVLPDPLPELHMDGLSTREAGETGLDGSRYDGHVLDESGRDGPGVDRSMRDGPGQDGPGIKSGVGQKK